MIDLCLISVPHTGTRWCMKVLTDARPKWHELNFNYSGPRHQVPHLYHGHCTKGAQTGMCLERVRQGTPLIMPMRHPYRVEESWRRRERDISGLIPAYRNMLDELLPHVKVFLPVDGSPLHRGIAERVLNELVGRALPYKWQVVENSQGATYNLHLADAEPSDEIKEIRRHPVFTEFYGLAEEEDEAIRRDREANGQSEARLRSQVERGQPTLAQQD